MEVYVARQPIFTKNLQVFGYELLFRVSGETAYTGKDGDFATSSVITDSFLVIGIDTLTRGKKAFINFTRNLLLDQTATILPKNLIVVEVLENIDPDSGIIAACARLKQLGYVIALDDFVFELKFAPLISLSDIIKLDMPVISQESSKKLIKDNCSRIKFLAEKIETQEEFKAACDAGCTYFQGYFFSKPVVISQKDIPSYKMNYIRILHEANLPEVDFNRIEQIIKRDISISYKLLKFINSAFFGFRTNITSIRQALTLLGIKEFKKLLSLIILKGLGTDQPDELLIMSMVRARFCELIAEDFRIRGRSSELFFTGMFSLIDAFIRIPMEDAIKDLPLSKDTKTALMGKQCLFLDILNLAEKYEKGKWDDINIINEQFKLNSKQISNKHLASLKWANQALGNIPS